MFIVFVQDDVKEWLKTKFWNEEWETVMEKWRQCSQLRRKNITSYAETKAIFQEWPILATNNGYHLVNILIVVYT